MESSLVSNRTNYKQLLDEVLVISRIIKVEGGVISRSRRLTLITLTELYIERNKERSWFCFFTDGKQDKASELDMITLRNHAPRSHMT